MEKSWSQKKPFLLYDLIATSLRCVNDVKAVDFGLPSDHSAVLLILKILFKRKKKNDNTNIDWNIFLEDEMTSKFNFN